MNYAELTRFERNYEKWYVEAKEEFENGEFYEDSYGSDFEVFKNGSVSLNGNMFHLIENAVTPWRDSKYYVD